MTTVSNYMTLKLIRKKYEYRIPFEFTLNNTAIEARCVYLQYHPHGDFSEFPSSIYVAFDENGVEVRLISKYDFESWIIERLRDRGCCLQGREGFNEVYYTNTSDVSAEQLLEIIDLFYDCCKCIFSIIEKERLLSDHHFIKKFLLETRQLLPENDILIELACTILDESRSRLMKIKEESLVTKKFTYKEFRKEYLWATRLLDTQLDNATEDKRMDDLIIRFYLIGDPIMDDLFGRRSEGFTAGKLLYMLYYAKKGLSAIQYSKHCRYLDCIERIVLKLAYIYICDRSMKAAEFDRRISSIYERFKENIKKKGQWT